MNGRASSTLAFDLNGNLTSDGDHSYTWDTENRLVRITYPGTNNFSDFSYDSLRRIVKIVETTTGSITSTRQFIWCSGDRCELRDASGTLVDRYFSRGKISGTSSRLYSQDRSGSIRELTDPSGNVQVQYQYGPFGLVIKTQGTEDSDFQFAEYYTHARSGLNLTWFRSYSPTLARWISRDPIEERDHVNHYAYVKNDPIGFADPLGLQTATATGTVIAPGPGTAIGLAIDIAIISGAAIGLAGIAHAAGQIVGSKMSQADQPKFTPSPGSKFKEPTTIPDEIANEPYESAKNQRCHEWCLKQFYGDTTSLGDCFQWCDQKWTPCPPKPTN